MVAGGVYPPDAAILLGAKRQWGGDRVLPSWGASVPCAQWEGVQCDAATGKVLKIQLLASGLSGPIPASLGNLTSLQYLL